MTPTDTLQGNAVKARLKWFNIPKGFGFVVPEEWSIDAFLHITTLKRAGLDNLAEGARLLCHIERNPKGAHVTEIVAILDAGALPKLERPSVGKTSADECCELTGTVKWYAPRKGFGFVCADDGGKDVFLHKNCLQRYGLATIKPLTPIVMTVRPAPKGREVVDFEILD